DPGSKVELVLKDSQSGEVDKRTLSLSEWSSADYALRLPEEAPLGHYEVAATVAGQKQSVTGGFLVAAYRRPDFRVDGKLAGVKLAGAISGRYLFGAAMAGRDVHLVYSKRPLQSVPRTIQDAFPEER